MAEEQKAAELSDDSEFEERLIRELPAYVRHGISPGHRVLEIATKRFEKLDRPVVESRQRLGALSAQLKLKRKKLEDDEEQLRKVRARLDTEQLELESQMKKQMEDAAPSEQLFKTLEQARQLVEEDEKRRQQQNGPISIPRQQETPPQQTQQPQELNGHEQDDAAQQQRMELSQEQIDVLVGGSYDSSQTKQDRVKCQLSLLVGNGDPDIGPAGLRAILEVAGIRTPDFACHNYKNWSGRLSRLPEHPSGKGIVVDGVGNGNTPVLSSADGGNFNIAVEMIQWGHNFAAKHVNTVWSKPTGGTAEDNESVDGGE
ncbi:hypothetical protein JKP88DRAFT_266607 [Tribonema minus]|uniref:Uncharacterized protein n=1 Tax=Tribonema minus TaxID=303371 RepID=A0A835ZE69_9STRA|nr:hypothetical protein JKP88DRAFT_266607 [Tribonema minus]